MLCQSGAESDVERNGLSNNPATKVSAQRTASRSVVYFKIARSFHPTMNIRDDMSAMSNRACKSPMISYSLFALANLNSITRSSLFDRQMFRKSLPHQCESARYTTAPEKYPNTASGVILLTYQKKSILAMPMAATPAADPMMRVLPPVPAQ